MELRQFEFNLYVYLLNVKLSLVYYKVKKVVHFRYLKS